MIYGSVCSGIEAASVAWHPLGWRGAFLSEIEAFPRAVLRHHYPDVPLHGDFTTIQAGDYAAIDVLVGGTPCQSFSVAGLRGGLADDRGNLALEYLRLAQRLRPRWLVWENVPGVLSSNGGRDFGSILGGLGELGYGFAYRVLDAQYVRVDGYSRAVPQRRRRVFVVGYLGDWRRAAAVLFERESLRWDSPPSREAREGIANAVEASASVSSGRGWWDESDVGSTLRSQESITKADILVAQTLSAARGKASAHDAALETYVPVSMTLTAKGGHCPDFETETFITQPGGVFDVVPIDMRQASRGRTITNNRAHGSGGPPGVGVGEPGDPAFTVSERGQAIAFNARQDPVHDTEACPPLDTDGGTNGVVQTAAARRLTPRECERLMGFPDDYTMIPYRGKEAADGPRYKALGNSMAVNCMRWLGRRIELVDGVYV